MVIESYFKKPFEKIKDYVNEANKRQRKEVREDIAEGVDSILSALEDGGEYSSLELEAKIEGATSKQAKMGNRYLGSEQGKELLAKRGKKLLKKTEHHSADPEIMVNGAFWGEIFFGGIGFSLGLLTGNVGEGVMGGTILGLLLGIGGGAALDSWENVSYSLEDAVQE